MKQLLIIVFVFFILHSSFSFAALPPLLIPQTGQILCYDGSEVNIDCAGTGQDGEIQNGLQWPTPRLVDNGDQSVTDKLTGLIWTKDANLIKTRDSLFDEDGTFGDGKVTWQHAFDYIKKLNAENYQGHNDWRLPNSNELGSMVISEVNLLSTPLSQGFINLPIRGQSGNYWSSTTDTDVSSSALNVGMDVGYRRNDKTTSYMNVWPVRSAESEIFSFLGPIKTGQSTCFDSNGKLINCAGSGQDGEFQLGRDWPVPRFSSNDDQTETDNLTGLIWSKDINPSGTSHTWQQALDYIKGLNMQNWLGHNDWRLPNINELASLINQQPQDLGEWLKNQGFTNISVDLISLSYWSSTTIPGYNNAAWIFALDSVTGHAKYFSHNVWPVRGGQIWSLDPLVISVPSMLGNIFVGTSGVSYQAIVGNNSAFTQPIRFFR